MDAPPLIEEFRIRNHNGVYRIRKLSCTPSIIPLLLNSIELNSVSNVLCYRTFAEILLSQFAMYVNTYYLIYLGIYLPTP